MHLPERAASRSFTTAESSAHNGDVEDGEDEFELGSEGEGDNAQSVPTSFEAEYDDGSGAKTAARHEGTGRRRRTTRVKMKRTTTTRPPRTRGTSPPSPSSSRWRRPSATGSQGATTSRTSCLSFISKLSKSPGPSTTPPAPRDASPIPIPALRARCAARAQSALRTLDLGLLLVCLIMPLLGVALMRSLASLFSPSSCSSAAPVSISWFSTALFGLATALRPPRELVSRTSTLHSQVHAHLARSSSSRDKNGDAESTQAQLAALRAQVARLDLAVAQLAAPDQEDAMYAYVEDALAPLEKGVRRVERRVGRLRAGRKELEGASQSHSSSAAGSKSKTIFVPAQPQFPHTTAFALVSSWFGGSPAQPPPPPHTTYVPPPLSPTNTNGNGAGKRRALDSIPEEESGDVPLHVLPHPRHTHPAYTSAHADVDAGAGGTLLPLLRAWLAACVALALYPLYVMLKPVRAVGRVVGMGLGVGR
ncbi:hypothetical protein B0H14DRAFT_279768 [Mycena olivaceomarginata]|nr:hypothetical protein B0H14DRAFT_279768 [Mycena olivaceomarginata]